MKPLVRGAQLCLWLLVLAGANSAVAFDARLGLPPLAGDGQIKPEAVQLGKALFFDKRLSIDGTISCSQCHDPKKAFSDGRVVARGVHGQDGSRNTPTVINAAFNESQFWDGRRAMLEEQARDPFVNPREHGLADTAALVTVITQQPDYEPLVRAAYAIALRDITADQVHSAIAAYERTLIAGDSPFDRFRYGKDEAALSPAALAGLGLFEGRARCSQCHRIGERDALFTDNRFHSTGVGCEKIQSDLPRLTAKVVAARGGAVSREFNRTSLETLIFDDVQLSELGRFSVTLDPKDICKFRTPSLRNVALTAPYLHDGSVATLEDVIEVELYARTSSSDPIIILTPVEKSRLVEFLKSLTSGALPN